MLEKIQVVSSLCVVLMHWYYVWLCTVYDLAAASSNDRRRQGISGCWYLWEDTYLLSPKYLISMRREGSTWLFPEDVADVPDTFPTPFRHLRMILAPPRFTTLLLSPCFGLYKPDAFSCSVEQHTPCVWVNPYPLYVTSLLLARIH